VFFSVQVLELHKIEFQNVFQPGEIEFLEAGLRQPTPLQATGTAELSGSFEEIRVSGHLSGSVECPCDRCLEPVVMPMDGKFDLFYRPADSEWETAPDAGLSDDEIEIGFYEGGGVDLIEVVREQVLLKLPMQRVCAPDCKGICPACGQNRNTSLCDCRVQLTDERWKALREL
jgi:uncharacterized protein